MSDFHLTCKYFDSVLREKMCRYRFAIKERPQTIDLKSVLAPEPFPPAGPSSTQANEIQIKFINIGNLTVGIDIPEVGFKLDLMP